MRGARRGVGRRHDGGARDGKAISIREGKAGLADRGAGLEEGARPEAKARLLHDRGIVQGSEAAPGRASTEASEAARGARGAVEQHAP